MDIQRLKPHLPWITLVVLVAIVGINDPGFLRPSNLLGIAGDIVPLFIMALGLTFAIYIGGIDLSAQSMANMVTVVASVYLASMGAWVTDYLSGWAGEHGRVVHSIANYRGPALSGDVTVQTAHVTDKYVDEEGRGIIAVKHHMANQTGNVMCVGTAEIALPRRAPK